MSVSAASFVLFIASVSYLHSSLFHCILAGCVRILLICVLILHATYFYNNRNPKPQILVNILLLDCNSSVSRPKIMKIQGEFIQSSVAEDATRFAKSVVPKCSKPLHMCTSDLVMQSSLQVQRLHTWIFGERSLQTCPSLGCAIWFPCRSTISIELVLDGNCGAHI